MSKLEFLDHVAIRVADIHASAQWYESVLGMTVFQPEAWKPFPVMVLAGESGIALFPDTDPPTSAETKRAFHIAFRIDHAELEATRLRLTAQGLDVTFEDHVHFHSIYFTDPDGYRLELTAKVPVD